VNHGNSGGPLISLKGDVIGINTFRLEYDDHGQAVQGMNFAVSGWTVQQFLDGKLPEASQPVTRGAPTAPAPPVTGEAPNPRPLSPAPTPRFAPPPLTAPTATSIIQSVVPESNRVWASVIAKNGASVTDLERVYAGQWLQEVRTGVQNMRDRGQYRVARPTAQIVVRNAQYQPDGRIEADVAEEWDDKVYNSDGSLGKTYPSHSPQSEPSRTILSVAAKLEGLPHRQGAHPSAYTFSFFARSVLDWLPAQWVSAERAGRNRMFGAARHVAVVAQEACGRARASRRAATASAGAGDVRRRSGGRGTGRCPSDSW